MASGSRWRFSDVLPCPRIYEGKRGAKYQQVRRQRINECLDDLPRIRAQLRVFDAPCDIACTKGDAMKCLLPLLFVWPFASLETTAAELDGARLKLAHTLKEHTATIRAIAMSPDGKLLASGGLDEKIRIWDVKTGTVRALLTGHRGAVRVVCFSPDGNLLASGAYGREDDIVRLWDIATGKQKAELTSTPTATRQIAFSPDGKTLACDDRGKSIRVCNVSKGKETAILTNSSIVREIVFSHDGRMLATPFYHGAGIAVWRTDGKQVGEADGEFTTAEFSPDGKTLTAGEFRTATRWNVSGDRPFAKIATVKPERVVPDPFPNARLSPAGRHLGTIDKDIAVVNLGGGLGTFGARKCRLILMDVETGKERTLFETQGRSNWFRLIGFLPNGKTVVVRNEDDSFSLIDAATGETTARLIAPELKRGSGYPQIAFANNGRTVAVSRGPAIKIWTTP